MCDEKINDLIERFREVKESKGFTDEQIAKLSGYTTIRIESLFNGNLKHPTFDLTIKVAEALGMSFTEVDKILGLNAPNTKEPDCKCYIGVYWNYEDSELMTRLSLEELINSNYSGAYTREQYCDRGFLTNLDKFDFCPKCGKRIDWDAIRENR